MRVFRRICALLIGFVLFVAGILKLMDPVGAGLVVEEYFKFFHLGFLAPVSKLTGIAFAFVETALGAAVLTGVWSRIVRWVALGVLGFFTIITLILWIFNPPFDCGCFGQAVHLTHFQTLVKNLILLALWAGAFLPLDRVFEAGKIKYVSFGISVVSVILFAFYSLMAVPLLDFASLKPGAEVIDNDGVSALSLVDANGEYRDSLAVTGNVLALSIYDPEIFKGWDRLPEVMAEASAAGFETLVLVSGTAEDVESVTSDPVVLSCLYLADHRTLMTLNRSNGGCVWISDGIVVKKWSSRSYPKQDDLKSLAEIDPVEAVISANSPERLKMQGFLLYVFAVMLLL